MVLQECAIEQYLTVTEVLEQRARYYPAPRPVGEVLEVAGITEKARSRVKLLSGGQQRRLDLALALVGDPELIFLDEPTTGFDPSARRAAWEVVASLASLGKTILLTTHYMDEAQALAAQVAVMSAGQVVALGPPDTLGGRDRAAHQVRFRLPGIMSSDVPTLGGPLTTAGPDGEWSLTTPAPPADLHTLTGWALERGIDLEALSVTQPTLEDVYLSLTDRAAQGGPFPGGTWASWPPGVRRACWPRCAVSAGSPASPELRSGDHHPGAPLLV